MVERDSKSEILREEKWFHRAKGRGNRWRMLRDIIAMCAVQPFTTTEVEDTALLGRGITHAKTYSMIQELERSGALEAITHEGKAFWRSSERGVASFLVTRKAIPARTVEAALIMRTAYSSGLVPKKS